LVHAIAKRYNNVNYLPPDSFLGLHIYYTNALAVTPVKQRSPIQDFGEGMEKGTSKVIWEEGREWEVPYHATYFTTSTPPPAVRQTYRQ